MLFVTGGLRGALFVPGVPARGVFGCLSTCGAEFLAREQPCGTGAAHSGIVIKYTLAACIWLQGTQIRPRKSQRAENVKAQLASCKTLASTVPNASPVQGAVADMPGGTCWTLFAEAVLLRRNRRTRPPLMQSADAHVSPPPWARAQPSGGRGRPHHERGPGSITPRHELGTPEGRAGARRAAGSGSNNSATTLRARASCA